MSSAADKANRALFETILSSPGMTEKVKINLNLSRQHLLLLSRLIETGLLAEKEIISDPILEAMPEGSVTDWKQLQEELLAKSGLSDFYDRLKKLT